MKMEEIPIKQGININIDKSYKLLSPLSIIILGLGLYSNNIKIINFALFTFIYGVWAWSIGSIFNIGADLRNRFNFKIIKPVTFPDLIYFGFILIEIISLILYLIFSLFILGFIS